HAVSGLGELRRGPFWRRSDLMLAILRYQLALLLSLMSIGHHEDSQVMSRRCEQRRDITMDGFADPIEDIISTDEEATAKLPQ
ncbi:hypothetical protein LTS02_018165, partial [Friedmanniomyces endolithicus]